MSNSNEEEAILKENKELNNEETKFTSIKFPKVSFIRILTYCLKLQLNKTFILLQIFYFICDTINMYVPIVDGNIINAITFEKDYELMIYWAKIRYMILFTTYIIDKIKDKVDNSNICPDIQTQLNSDFYLEILKKEMEFHDNVPMSKIQKIYNENICSIYLINLSNFIYNIKCVLKIIVSFSALLMISYELLIIQLLNFCVDIYQNLKNFNEEDSWKQCDDLYTKKNNIFSEFFSILNL